MRLLLLVSLLTIICTSFTNTNVSEKHLKNITQLTYGGNNAEAYFSYNGKMLTLQSDYKKWGASCDQIYVMQIAKAAADSNYVPNSISNNKGRTTCSYFLKDNKHILFASTRQGGDDCPLTGDLRKGGKYLWPLFPTYDIYISDLKGAIKKQLTTANGYDAEATVSPDGKKIVFTSTRSGDIELWTMDIDGSNQKQVTSALGYDGGAFFSPDGNKLIFRASRPKTDEEIREYKELLAQNLVAPTNMELFICNVDGTQLKQLTNLGKANWAPFFHPSGKKIIFSSNHASTKGFNFQLYMIDIDGAGLEQITTESIFNSFAMFSPDGKKLVFSSNRNNHGTHDTNVFIADWQD
jgi:Tol biopolymer transport system component